MARFFLSAILIFVMGAALTPQSTRAPASRGLSRNVRGIILNVDATSVLVAAANRTSKELVRFEADPDTSISLDGTPCSLDVLKVGMSITTGDRAAGRRPFFFVSSAFNSGRVVRVEAGHLFVSHDAAGKVEEIDNPLTESAFVRTIRNNAVDENRKMADLAPGTLVFPFGRPRVSTVFVIQDESQPSTRPEGK